MLTALFLYEAYISVQNKKHSLGYLEYVTDSRPGHQRFSVVFYVISFAG
jgi:hypothetical protein